MLPWIADSLNNLWNTFDWAKAANIGALALCMYTYFRVVKPFIQKMSAFFEDWFGERPRPGIKPRPGVMRRLQYMDREHQLFISSEIEQNRRITALEKEVSEIKKMIGPIHTYVEKAVTGEIPVQRSSREESKR